MSTEPTATRFARIVEIAASADVEAIDELLGYLDDDRPAVVDGDRPYVVELGMVALEALQHLCRYHNLDIDIGRHRITQPVALGELLGDEPEGRPAATQRAIDEYDRRRHDGRTESEVLASDRVSRSTPPQERTRLLATPKAPAPPYLRIGDRRVHDRTLGYVHRSADEPWRYSFAGTLEGTQARRDLLTLVGRLGADSLPRVRVDAHGAPLLDPDGALELAGTIDDESPDRVSYLRSLAAFADALFSVEVVTGSADGTVGSTHVE